MLVMVHFRVSYIAEFLIYLLNIQHVKTIIALNNVKYSVVMNLTGKMECLQ